MTSQRLPSTTVARRLARGRVALLAVVLGAFLTGGPRALALSVIAPSFPELVANADEIVRLRVVRVASRWEQTAWGRVIRTYVDGEVLRSLKGPARTTVTLRFLGGTVGDESMTVPDMPRLEEGQTYVLFVAENGRAICPLVAAMHGSYPVIVDAATGEERIARSNRVPLRSVDDVSLPIVTQAGHPALRLAAGPGLPRSAFEEAVLQEIARQGK